MADHEHHLDSLRLFQRCRRDQACCSAHSLAEVYSTLTRLPPPHRVPPDRAVTFLESIHSRLSLVTLDGEVVMEAIREAAANRVSGGTIYDALIARCALQSGAERIMTWNVRHFQLLGIEVVRRIGTPADEGLSSITQ